MDLSLSSPGFSRAGAANIERNQACRAQIGLHDSENLRVDGALGGQSRRRFSFKGQIPLNAERGSCASNFRWIDSENGSRKSCSHGLGNADLNRLIVGAEDRHGQAAFQLRFVLQGTFQCAVQFYLAVEPLRNRGIGGQQWADCDGSSIDLQISLIVASQVHHTVGLNCRLLDLGVQSDIRTMLGDAKIGLHIGVRYSWIGQRVLFAGLELERRDETYTPCSSVYSPAAR